MTEAPTKPKFFVGQRVQMTPEAIEQGLQGTYVNRRTGVIKKIEVMNGLQYLKIRRDGAKQSDGPYHPDFWEPADDQAIAPNLCPTCGQKLP